jgi:hypothetical protein
MQSVPSHQTVRLCDDRHCGVRDGVSVLELASMLAGERFSDRPRSVCPVVRGFLRAYNNLIDDERRQDLYGYAAQAVGTAEGGRRARKTRMRHCRAFLERYGDGSGSTFAPTPTRRAERAERDARRTASTSTCVQVLGPRFRPASKADVASLPHP